MNIGVIGSGDVGTTLGSGWIRAGHSVMFGTREPDGEKARRLASETGAQTGTWAEAVAFGDVVVLATPWPVTENTVKSVGTFAGKPLLDCTNPLAADLSLAVVNTTSGAEIIAAAAPSAKVVKIFNTTGSNNMANPTYGSERATMFYAGDDRHAKQVAHTLAEELGFEAMDAGPLRAARYLEPMAAFWISLAFQQQLGREIAFRLMRR
jgi:predicted dinucleotide-binding enzyme